LRGDRSGDVRIKSRHDVQHDSPSGCHANRLVATRARLRRRISGGGQRRGAHRQPFIVQLPVSLCTRCHEAAESRVVYDPDRRVVKPVPVPDPASALSASASRPQPSTARSIAVVQCLTSPQARWTDQGLNQTWGSSLALTRPWSAVCAGLDFQGPLVSSFVCPAVQGFLSAGGR
jgi:hypothetical protein